MPDLCDFSFYQEQYKGTLPETEFMRFARQAQAFLAFATRGKSERELFAEENTRLALCAVAEQWRMRWQRKNGLAQSGRKRRGSIP